MGDIITRRQTTVVCIRIVCLIARRRTGERFEFESAEPSCTYDMDVVWTGEPVSCD